MAAAVSSHEVSTARISMFLSAEPADKQIAHQIT